MKTQHANVVICGAGLAGVSAAYFLAARQGIQDVVLVDERPPLSLTSDHSTECYRNWWPDQAMVGFMNRSIDLLEELAQESHNVFHLNRRGYLYCTGDEARVEDFHKSAEAVSKLGGGPLRVHSGASREAGYSPAPAEGYAGQPGGADLLLDGGLIRKRFPYLAQDVKAALHVRRAGWLSAQQLGMYFLDQARRYGARLVSGRVSGVETRGGRVAGVRLEAGSAAEGEVLIDSEVFVDAAGPFVNEVAGMLGVRLPVYNELHLKIAIRDDQNVLDRSAPLVIWSDAQRLDWSPEEREALAEQTETRRLLEELPSGVHARPEGGPDSQMILILWEYETRLSEPTYPVAEDPLYLETALRGLARPIPGMQAYLKRMPHPHIDGGYYTRTRENRPLVCKLPVEGAYLIGGLSGFGLMASCAAGELLSLHVAAKQLPDYAPAFDLERYQDPQYLREIEAWGDSGQL